MKIHDNKPNVLKHAGRSLKFTSNIGVMVKGEQCQFNV